MVSFWLWCGAASVDRSLGCAGFRLRSTHDANGYDDCRPQRITQLMAHPIAKIH
jgi:hypothetical protein